MKTFIQITKIKTVLLYIMQSFPKGVECAKLFRILYFAQQDYLVKYGKVLIEDSFMALKYGPAPTYIYRVLQAVKEKPTEESFNDFLAGIEVHEQKIYASAKPDMNYISGSDKRCLDAAITKYKDTDPYDLGSPDKSGGKFFNSIENLHLCTMNNQGLLALAQLILPSEILSNFEVVRVEEEASLIRIYLDESVKAEYKENPEIESKGFCEAVTIRDFPIRDKGVDLIVRRRKWYDKQNNRYFSDSYDLKAEETRYSKEFAAFLKGVYGDDSYDLPFA